MTFPAGSRLLAEDLLYVGNPPGAQLRQSSGQSTSSGTFAAITFTQEDYDNYNGHSTSVNTSRYTCQVAGRYQLSGKVAFVNNTTGARATRWQVNGSVVSGSQTMVMTTTGSNEIAVTATTITVLLAVNDYVELAGWQNSGGNLNTSVANSETQSFMHVRWVGPS